MIGAFTSGEKNANAPTTTIAAPHGIAIGEQQERQRHRDDREGGELQEVDLLRELLRDERAERARRRRTRRRGSRATCAFGAVVEVRERLHADDQPLRDAC